MTKKKNEDDALAVKAAIDKAEIDIILAKHKLNEQVAMIETLTWRLYVLRERQDKIVIENLRVRK